MLVKVFKNLEKVILWGGLRTGIRRKAYGEMGKVKFHFRGN